MENKNIDIIKPDKIYINLDDSIIDRIVNDYTSTLKDIDLMYSAKGNAFTGLIKKLHKKLNITSAVYDDINTLNDIWDVYTELCYRFNQYPTIQEFALLIGSSRETIYAWMREDTRLDYCSSLNLSRSDTVTKWANECKIGRYKLASTGNVGGIFLCKAVDGMVETAPMQVKQSSEYKSIEQIASERGLELHENQTQLPPPAPPAN